MKKALFFFVILSFLIMPACKKPVDKARVEIIDGVEYVHRNGLASISISMIPRNEFCKLASRYKATLEIFVVDSSTPVKEINKDIFAKLKFLK